MRSLLAWILVLHTFHLPIPYPDLDGECCGKPICSLSELQAWHVLIIGVRPNDDIDRGPFRDTGDPWSDSHSETPYGDTAVVSTASVPLSLEMAGLTRLLASDLRVSDGAHDGLLRLRFGEWGSPPPQPIARAACICYCCWQV